MSMFQNDSPDWKDDSSLNKFKEKFLKGHGWVSHIEEYGWLKYIFTVLPVQIVIAIRNMLVGGFSIYPIWTYHFIFFWFHISWRNLLAAGIILLIEMMVAHIALCIASANENKDLVSFLIEEVEKVGIKLRRYNLMDYLREEESIKKLKAFYPKDESKNPEKIGTVFYLEKPRNILTPGSKAFTVINYPNPNHMPGFEDANNIIFTRSYVFAHFKPEQMKEVINEFTILHEIGHTTEDAQYVEQMAIHHRISALLFPLLFFFFYGFDSIAPYLFLVPYIGFIYMGALSRVAKVNVEYYSDTFAIHIMKLKSNFNELSMLLKLVIGTDEERLGKVLDAINKKQEGFISAYSVAFLQVYPKKMTLFFVFILTLLCSIFFFEGEVANLVLLPIPLLLIGVLLSSYFIYQQAKRLIEINAIFDRLEVE